MGVANCQHCGRERVLATRREPDGTLKDFYLSCICPYAEADQQREREEQAQRNAQKAEIDLLNAYKRAGIPKRYMKATHEMTARARQSLVEGGFYLFGTQGTGKTHLALSVACELVRESRKVRVETSTSLAEKLRSVSDDDRSEVERLARIEFLIIDDLGKEKPSAYVCERLFGLINDRYNNLLPIGITSNYAVSDLAKQLSEGEVGKSIASRLMEMTKQVAMSGKDRRHAR